MILKYGESCIRLLFGPRGVASESLKRFSIFMSPPKVLPLKGKGEGLTKYAFQILFRGADGFNVILLDQKV